MSKGKVLVVDDEEVFCKLLQKILLENGYEVTYQLSVTSAIDVLASQEFDLVITDINMPEFSGLTLLAKIKEYRPLVPVIIATAYSTPENFFEATKNQAYSYLTKPFDTKRLIAVVDKAINYYHALRITHNKNDSAPI